MLCLVFFLGGCARGQAQSTIVCHQGETSSYGQIIAQALPSYTVIAEQEGHSVFAYLQEGNEVEAFAVQAIPALEHGLAGHWYPHYLATVVIAVDRDITDARIDGWSDLTAADDIIGYADHNQYNPFLLSAIAYGLEGAGFTLKKATGLLGQLHSEGRLALQGFDAPIVICYDYQAAALLKGGRNIEIIIPSEGTLTYQRGLLSGTELLFSGDIASLLLAAGFRLPDGRCDAALYPARADYKQAALVANHVHLNTVAQDVNHLFRRQVLHTRLYSSANGREHQFFVLLYMILVVVWTASALHRAMQNDVRRAVLATGVILLGWITLRLIKYQLAEALVLNRYLWYGFYLFQLALPLVLLWLAWVIDKPDAGAKPATWLRLMSAINGLLMALVLTNDLHNWAFRLDLSNPNWSHEYGYGIVFFSVTAAWSIQLIIAVTILIIKSRQAPRKGGLVLPLLFSALLILYAIGYIMRVPLAWDSDYTMVVGLFALLFMEVCMRSGVLPVNTKYARLFNHSPLNMQIIDGAGRPALASATAAQVDGAALQSALKSYPQPLEQDENTLLFATGITGGYALWREDISSINQLHAQIGESVRKLKLANALLAEEERIKRDLDEETAHIQLMTQLEQEIAG
ncbi:MAG: ABC transporter substrate-binding protein, partial [Clostridia bacterium]|nr:ABC transporter substrate-binding protein [Clostridia bacterium]